MGVGEAVVSHQGQPPALTPVELFRLTWCREPTAGELRQLPARADHATERDYLAAVQTWLTRHSNGYVDHTTQGLIDYLP